MYLKVIEQLEPIVRQQFIDKRMLDAKNYRATYQQTTQQGIPHPSNIPSRATIPQSLPINKQLEITSIKKTFDELMRKKMHMVRSFSPYKILNII